GPKSVLDKLGFPARLLEDDTFGQFGGVCLLKGGILCADAVSTVSPTHAREIVTPEGGFGLHMFLQRAGVTGILNGLDVDEWDPEQQPALTFPFEASTLPLKRANKHEFLNRAGFSPKRWHLPLVVGISRLVEQKGFDLVADALPSLLAKRSFN